MTVRSGTRIQPIDSKQKLARAYDSDLPPQIHSYNKLWIRYYACVIDDHGTGLDTHPGEFDQSGLLDRNVYAINFMIEGWVY